MNAKTFTLPLPPTTNHAYAPSWRWAYSKKGQKYRQSIIRKADELIIWEQMAHLIVGNWAPPADIVFDVMVGVYLPKSKLWKPDLAGYEKAAVDAVLGKRNDNRISRETLCRYLAQGSEGYVTVTVRDGDKRIVSNDGIGYELEKYFWNYQ